MPGMGLPSTSRDKKERRMAIGYKSKIIPNQCTSCGVFVTIASRCSISLEAQQVPFPTVRMSRKFLSQLFPLYETTNNPGELAVSNFFGSQTPIAERRLGTRPLRYLQIGAAMSFPQSRPFTVSHLFVLPVSRALLYFLVTDTLCVANHSRVSGESSQSRMSSWT